MKLCKKCFREFDENDNTEDSPAKELGDIFISGMGDVDTSTGSLSSTPALYSTERNRHCFSRPCDSLIGNDCCYTDSDYPRTVVFGH
jgi:hypothetical protein